MQLSFDLAPQSQIRTRYSKRPFPHEYDVPKVKQFKKIIAMLGKAKMHSLGQKPIDGALMIIITFYRPIQKSISKKEHAMRANGIALPVVKPDWDNYIKSFQDALNGVVWTDDALITDSYIKKRYADHPRIELEVLRLQG